MSDFIPLSIPNLSGNEMAYVQEAIQDGWVSSVGPHVDKFEKAFAAYLNIPYAVACGNGTAALHIALLVAGVKPNEEVLVPNLTFVATLNAIKYCSAIPVLMDSEWQTMGLDVQKVGDFLSKETKLVNGATVNRKTGNKIGAIMPMHTLGFPVDMDPLLVIGERYNIPIIEDATESLGSTYKNKPTGGFGLISCFSFNGNKIMTTGGGGMIVTSDGELARKAKHLTTTAKVDPIEYDHDLVGYNYRMVNVLAAIGLGQLEQMEEFVNIKRANLEKYKAGMESVQGISIHTEPNHSRSNYWLYAAILEKGFKYSIRELIEVFKTNKIQVRPIWKLMNMLPMYKDCQAYHCNASEDIYNRTLNIPCSTHISDVHIDRVLSVFKEIAGK